MASLIKLTIALISVICIDSLIRNFKINCRQVHVLRQSTNNNDDIMVKTLDVDDIIASDPILQAYLKGPAGKPWTGSRDILKRKGDCNGIVYVHLNDIGNNFKTVEVVNKHDGVSIKDINIFML